MAEIQPQNIIHVDRSHVDITKLIQSEHSVGEFTIVKEHPIAAKVQTFDLNTDVIFKSYTTANESISAEEKIRRIEAEGDVPLDIYCLRAILHKHSNIEYMSRKYWQGRGTPSLKSIDFPGTILYDGRRNHIFFIEFAYNTGAIHYKAETIAPVEIQDSDWGIGDPSLVFTKQFIKQYL